MIYTGKINASLLKIKIKDSMILTCPNCSSTFQLPASALAPEGKKVKCKNCTEVWFQLPDPDELLEDIEHSVEQEEGEIEESAVEENAEEPIEEANEDSVEGVLEEETEHEAPEKPPEDDLEDIPEAVKPREESSPLPAAGKQGGKAKYFAMAAGIVLLAMSPLFVLKDTIMRAAPQSIAMYSALGLIDTRASEGLIFDQIRAEMDAGTLNILGQIINLTSTDTILPTIEIALRDSKGKTLKSWYVEMPNSTLEAEGVLPFHSDTVLPDDIEQSTIKDIQARFVLMKSNQEPSHTTKDHHKSDADESH